MVVFSQNWWALAIRGIVALLFGLAAFVWPVMTLAVLVLLFGAYAIVDGVFALVAAIRVQRANARWWGLLIEGILGIAAGVVTFLWPAITAITLLFLIAFWAIITGIFEVVAAVRLRQEIRGEWLLALNGIASLIFGIILLVRPGIGALAVVWLIGAYAIIAGLLLLGLAFRLRGWQTPGSQRTSAPVWS